MTSGSQRTAGEESLWQEPSAPDVFWKKNVHKQLLKCIRMSWFPQRPLEDLLWARHPGPNVAKLLIHFEVKYVQYKQKPKAVLLMLLIKNKQKKNYSINNCKILLVMVTILFRKQKSY